MKGLTLWLASMVQPVVARVLLALGFQVVTIAGVQVAIGQIKTMFLQYASQVNAEGFQMALLAGVGTAFGMIFGAITFRLAMYQLLSATKVLGLSGGGS